ncbi:MAG: class I SAM-dependent methyltransferase [Bryobacteraceae bacterium]|nr:class I SAM-dependent methyltransferase [Bryobacterales bacterium]MEB2362596.1 class I SAM-dependent methyltransferase [Bryobacterales bacterium]NUN02874.1 class I SAM-dependent methyltransferase [Bryobacteraceae bacterium]
MSQTNTPVDARLWEYIQNASRREPDLLRRLREETARLPEAHMQITPEQGQFLGLLVRLLEATEVLEVGVFTGYSSLSLALALPDHGRVVACDRSEEFTSMARRYWREAGVEHKIDLRVGPALDTLDGLLSERRKDTFDLVFIDADKQNYDNYYERAILLIRPGGLIALDNVLWHGAVIDETVKDESTISIRAFNRKIHQDDRVWASMVPIGDGLTLALKKQQP